MSVIYIDEFLFVNFVMNYMILFLTKSVLKYKISVWRLVFGSIAGSLYAALMFLPFAEYALILPAKILFSLILVICVFSLGSISNILRTTAVFYLVCFVLGGCGYAISNAVSQSDFPLKLLFITITIAYILISCVGELYKKISVRSNYFATIDVWQSDGHAVITGLIDTGNNLYEPLTNIPVIVVESDCLKSLPLASVKMRYIPYNSLGNSDGMLVGFKPDIIKINDTSIDAIVAISQNKLSADRSYYALINPVLL